jgi:pimeloyl-ACP methyl ester carboxylesterase
MYIELGNKPIYVNVQGQGEDALLLHGVPDSAEIWNSLITKIDDKYRCFAPDLPGMHRSDVPEGFEFNFDSYADYVDALVTKLEIKTPLTLIIHDWGGIYGFLWACKYPHKVKRIIGGDFPFSPQYKWHEWATIWRLPILGEISMLAMNWPLFKWELKRSSRRLSEAQMKETYEGRVTRARARRTVLKMYRSANVEYFGDWLQKQKDLSDAVPIDLIWGENDPHVPPFYAKMIPARSLTIVPSCGHWVPQEAPEVYEQVILNP